MININEATGMTTYRAGSNAPNTAKHRVRGALPQPTYVANTPTSAVVWSDGGAGGTFQVSGSLNATAVYTPKNKTATVIVTATDSTNSHTKALQVFGTMPVQPQVGFELEDDVETKVKLARDTTPYFREDGDPKLGFSMSWMAREVDAQMELRGFWNDHRKVMQWYYINIEANVKNLMRFTSSMKSVYDSPNRWNMAASVKGDNQNETAEGAEPLHLRVNCGGMAQGVWMADTYFATGYTGTFAATPNSTGIIDPAPDQVYKDFRYAAIANGIIYVIPNLRPNHNYTFKMYFNVDFTRHEQVSLQGVSKPIFSIPADYVVLQKIYEHILSDNLGNIVFGVIETDLVINPVINGFEIIEE